MNYQFLNMEDQKAFNDLKADKILEIQSALVGLTYQMSILILKNTITHLELDMISKVIPPPESSPK